MEKVEKTRRVAVFNIDGSAIYDQVDDNTTSASQKSQTLPAEKLWRLIQVFVQFSRDVQGGNVRRLVFRSPKVYAPSTHRFEPSPHPSNNHNQAVTIVYIAQSDRYVVAVTERLVTSTTQNMLDTHSPLIPVQKFCHSILESLHSQHDTFLVSSSNANTAVGSVSTAKRRKQLLGSHHKHDDVDKYQLTYATPTMTNFSRQTSTDSTHSRVSLPLSDTLNQISPPTEPPLPIPSLVPIDHVKLSEFIKNEQNLLGT